MMMKIFFCSCAWISNTAVAETEGENKKESDRCYGRMWLSDMVVNFDIKVESNKGRTYSLVTV